MGNRRAVFRRAWILLLLSPGVAWGQGRGAHAWNSLRLRGLSRIGGDFADYSAGLGGLERSSPYGGTGLLRSNIGRGAMFELGRSSAAASSGLTSLPKVESPTGRDYGAETLLRPSGKLTGSAVDEASRALTGMSLYLEAMGHSSHLSAEEDKPISTLVPTEPSLFQRRMKKGDEAFRAGRYLKAETAFDIALVFARQVPETHLSLVHANFALGRYHTAAQHLRRALELLPELPLVRLKVRRFYGEEQDFEGHVKRLKERAEALAEDPDCRLLLAYFSYFDGKDSEATEALRSAFGLSRRFGDDQQANLEAVGTFWAGAVSAGRASGELTATTLPAYLLLPPLEPEPTTRPAGTEGGRQGEPTPPGRSEEAAKMSEPEDPDAD